MAQKLYRSRKRRVIGGVAAGLGDYINLDPILVRILLIVISLINGIGIILYIILWIIIPEEPWEVAYEFGETDSEANSSDSKNTTQSESKADDKSNLNFDDINAQMDNNSSNTGRTIFGIILIAVGLLFLAGNIFPYIDFVDFLPLALIVAGIALIFNSIKK
jgi:phage shock protein C